MSRRKSEHERELRGNPGHQKRRRKTEQVDDIHSMPTPPDHLSEVAKGVWNELGPRLHEKGLLIQVDRAAFAVLCDCVAMVQQVDREIAKHPTLLMQGSTGRPIGNPLLKLRIQYMDQPRKSAAEFAITPMSCDKMGIQSQQIRSDPDGLEALLTHSQIGGPLWRRES